jgi:hypothetical protein
LLGWLAGDHQGRNPYVDEHSSKSAVAIINKVAEILLNGVAGVTR